jgi:hypothetical protein
LDDLVTASARKESTLAADRARFETRDMQKAPKMSREDVDAVLAAMTDEGRAHVAMMATIKAGLRPATWPR